MISASYSPAPFSVPARFCDSHVQSVHLASGRIDMIILSCWSMILLPRREITLQLSVGCQKFSFHAIFSTYRFDVFHLTPPLVRPILISFDEIKSRSLILRFLNWTSVLFSSFFFCRECHWIAVFNIFISLSSFPWFLFSFSSHHYLRYLKNLFGKTWNDEKAVSLIVVLT